MLKISIPTPCQQDWNQMNPNQLGRHCSSCFKTVVDFTNMTDIQVKYFLLQKKDEHICGRFHESQLNNIHIELPQNIFSLQMPIWKRFLAASLLIFSITLFSCEVNVMGAPVKPIDEANHYSRLDNTISGAPDTIPVKHSRLSKQILGKPAHSNSGIKGKIRIMPSQPVDIDSPVMLGEPAIIDTTPKPQQQEPQIMGKIMMADTTVKIRH